MSLETTLHFFCGKMAAGNSTLARSLASDEGAVLVVEDHWLSGLYPGEITNIPEYVECSARLKELMFEHVCSLLEREVSVVLDFPGNTVAQRDWFRSIIMATGVRHVLHFV